MKKTIKEINKIKGYEYVRLYGEDGYEIFEDDEWIVVFAKNGIYALNDLYNYICIE